jgi:hypothetical protein
MPPAARSLRARTRARQRSNIPIADVASSNALECERAFLAPQPRFRIATSVTCAPFAPARRANADKNCQLSERHRPERCRQPHQDIGVTRSGDEAWQVMGGGLDEVTRSCDSPFRKGKRRAERKPRPMAQVLRMPPYLAQSRSLASLSACRDKIGLVRAIVKFPRHSRQVWIEKRHSNHGFASTLWVPKFVQEARRRITNFGKRVRASLKDSVPRL